MQIVQILRGPSKEFENSYDSYFLVQDLKEIYLSGSTLKQIRTIHQFPHSLSPSPPPEFGQEGVKIWKIAFFTILKSMAVWRGQGGRK